MIRTGRQYGSLIRDNREFRIDAKRVKKITTLVMSKPLFGISARLGVPEPGTDRSPNRLSLPHRRASRAQGESHA
jgi:hypothetical protein